MESVEGPVLMQPGGFQLHQRLWGIRKRPSSWRASATFRKRSLKVIQWLTIAGIVTVDLNGSSPFLCRRRSQKVERTRVIIADDVKLIRKLDLREMLTNWAILW